MNLKHSIQTLNSDNKLNQIIDEMFPIIWVDVVKKEVFKKSIDTRMQMVIRMREILNA